MKNRKIKLSQELELEARAFDEQIQERIRNGHIPDLRLVEPCDWFRNNIWRRPYLIDLSIGRVLRFFLAHLNIISPEKNIVNIIFILP